MQFDNFCKFTYYLSFHSIDLSLCHSTAFLPPLFSISQLLIILLSPICCFQDLLCVRIWGILTMILPRCGSLCLSSSGFLQLFGYACSLVHDTENFENIHKRILYIPVIYKLGVGGQEERFLFFTLFMIYYWYISSIFFILNNVFQNLKGQLIRMHFVNVSSQSPLTEMCSKFSQYERNNLSQSWYYHFLISNLID